MLNEYDELVEQRYLSKSERGDLVLYNYTEKSTYDRHWTPITLNSRGLIFNRHTGECMAKPFPKFFNVGETEATQIHALPQEQYEVYEKYDGSLGILYWDGDEPRVATRGSFYSDQAERATLMLQARHDLGKLPRCITLLWEIIYPTNRIVVDYGPLEEMRLLAAYDRVTGLEVPRQEVEIIGQCFGFPVAQQHSHDMPRLLELQATMPRGQEGFVLRFASGLRVKVKGHEYLKYVKLLTGLTPLAIWNVMEAGEIPADYLAEYPEELRGEAEALLSMIQQQYKDVLFGIHQDARLLPARSGDDLTAHRKAVGLFLKDFGPKLKHPRAVFPRLLGEEHKVAHYVKQAIRPVGNVMRAWE